MHSRQSLTPVAGGAPREVHLLAKLAHDDDDDQDDGGDYVGELYGDVSRRRRYTTDLYARAQLEVKLPLAPVRARHNKVHTKH